MLAEIPYKQCLESTTTASSVLLFTTLTFTASPNPDLPQPRFLSDLRLTPDNFKLFYDKDINVVDELVMALSPTSSENGA